MGRISGSDSIHSALLKMAEGNPDAISAMLNIYGRTLEIDPTIGLGQMHYIFLFDDFGIYGGTLWTLYKDVCDENVESVLTLFRAWQLGLLRRDKLTDIIVKGQRFDTSELLARVQALLPTFGAKKKVIVMSAREPEPAKGADDSIAGAVLGAAMIDEVADWNAIPAPPEEKPFEGFKDGETGGGGAGGDWENMKPADLPAEPRVPDAPIAMLADDIPADPSMAAPDDPVSTVASEPDTTVDTPVEADTPDSSPDVSGDTSDSDKAV